MTFPRYRSHKVVEAAKVIDVTRLNDGGADLVLTLGFGVDDVEHRVDAAYVSRMDEAMLSDTHDHTNPIGGYWVRYPDGYESWSPARAFEDGYEPHDGDPS